MDAATAGALVVGRQQRRLVACLPAVERGRHPVRGCGLANLPAANAPASAWDEVASAGERVARVARRHIEDEEEIVIPAVLGVAR